MLIEHKTFNNWEDARDETRKLNNLDSASNSDVKGSYEYSIQKINKRKFIIWKDEVKSIEEIKIKKKNRKTKDEIKKYLTEILDLRKQNKSFREISEILNLNKSTIITWVQKYKNEI